MISDKIEYHEEHNISYYDASCTGSGDLDYRQERCKLDIYYPVQEPGFITLVHFHGGGLQAGEKEFPEILKNRGIAIVAPNYRLSSAHAKCPDYLEDAAAAVAWVFRNIVRYGGDSTKIYLSGGSAGGYLAAMLGLAPAYLARHNISNQQLAGVIPVSGQMTTHFQIVNERYNIISFTANPVPVIDEYAPLFYIHKKIPPLVLLTGDSSIEIPGRPEENKLIATLLTRIAGYSRVECLSLSGYDHGDIYNPAYLLLLKKVQEMEFQKFVATGPRCVPLKIRKTETPKGDGFPDEMAWRMALWTKLVSRTGEPFEPSTAIAFLYDIKHLYFKIIGEEPSIEKMVQKYFGHDAPCLWDGDCVELYLSVDPAKPENTFQFVVAPDGSIYDAELAEFDALGVRWNLDGLHVASKVEDGRWTVELAMPLNKLGIVSFSRQLAGNIYRRRMADGDDRTANWSPTMVSRNYIPELFGHMTFST